MTRRRTRTASVLAMAILVALAIGLFMAHRARDLSSGVVSGRIDNVSPVSLVDRQIAVAESRLRQMPENADAYAELSAGFMRKARESGDSSYYARAEVACQRALELEPENYAALRQLAWVYSGQHRFRESLAIAERALARRPKDPWNYGLAGDALVELGDYEAAAKAFQKMNDLRPDTAAYSRAAYIHELYGDPEGAIRIMKMAHNAAGWRDPEARAWCLTQMGHLYWGIGRLQQAEQHYTWALQAFPNYYNALFGMGRVLAAQQKFDEAIDYYNRSIAVAPQQQAVANLGDLFAFLGRDEDAARQYELIEVIEQMNRSSQVQPAAWLALSYADHDMRLDEAVAIAERHVAERKDIRTYDALAWAYYKLGRYAKADKAIQQTLRLGTKNASYLFHAGMIKVQLSQSAAARTYLQRALKLNSAFHPTHAGEARRTLEALRAGDQGFRG